MSLMMWRHNQISLPSLAITVAETRVRLRLPYLTEEAWPQTVVAPQTNLVQLSHVVCHGKEEEKVLCNQPDFRDAAPQDLSACSISRSKKLLISELARGLPLN